MKKIILIAFLFASLFSFGQAPQRFNNVIVTGDITSPKFIKTGSNADSVLLGNGSARAISTFKTDTVSLSNRINAKATGNGTASGTNTGDETLTSIKTKLGAATAVSDGYLKYQDFAAFSGKVSNATHTGDVTGSTALTLATVNSNVGTFNKITINAKGLATAGSNVSYEPSFSKNTGFNKNFGTTTGTVLEGRTFGTAANSAVGDFQQTITGLTTNYIPKWNGSNFVNSLISDDGNYSYFDGNKLTKLVSGNVRCIYTGGNGLYFTNQANTVDLLNLSEDGNLKIYSTTPSTSPATGALVVGGGIGAGGKVYATGFATAVGTSSQYLMADGSVSTGAGVNQTQTTVNGSTSGTMVCSMPFQTGSYKKVIIRLNALVGSAEYTFPVPFSNTPIGSGNTANVGFSASSFTATNPTNSTSWYILEGY